jgi:putative ABC transport system substrate-binding protein
VKRREFISLLGGAAASWPLAARAQQFERKRRIGVLMAHAESDAEFHNYLSAFRDGLQKLGWMEGRNIQIESRWGALDDAEARQRAAKELIALQPGVILTQNTPPTASMLEQTRTISHRLCGCCRSGRQWLRSEPSAARGRAPGRTRRAHGVSRDGRQYWVLQIC